MSLEGVLKGQKHGGAHVVKIESLADHCLPLSEHFLVNGNLSESIESGCLSVKNEDGEPKLHDADENGINENLPFLPELGTDCFDINYESAVVENNAEWLKVRCKNFSQVESDLSAHAAGDDNLEFPIIPLENTVNLNRSLTNDGCDHFQQKPEAISSSIPAQDVNILPCADWKNNVLLRYITNNNGNVVGKLSHTQGDLGFGIHNECIGKNNTTQANVTLNNAVANTTNNKRITLLNGIESNAGCGSGSLNGIKSKLIIKDGVLTLIPNNAFGKLHNGEEQQKVTFVGLHAASPSERVANKSNFLSQQNEHFSIYPSSVSQPLAENLALTTISIATDRQSNSTKIMVDSSQGRQMYQLNISDLLKIQNQTLTNNVHIPTTPTATVSSSQGFVVVQDPMKECSAISQDGVASEMGKAKLKQMYLCNFDGCGKMFKNIAKLTVHNMSHTGERPYKCSEPGCDWAFTKAYKLKRHEESHQGNKDFKCSYCNKKFTTVYNLKAHIKQHSRPCTEECPVEDCDLKFQTHRELDKHLKTHEGVEKTYKCPYQGCNKLFLSPHCLGSHPRVHQSEPQDLTCQFDGCGRKFDKLCRLKQHQRTHTGERPYVCHFSGCTWAFSTASKLTRHMTKHTNKRKWICNECGKAFMRAEHLKGHMITHTGIKPFTCPVDGCGQKFVAKSSVYVHLKRHDKVDKDITYHCPMEACQKKYTNKANLRQHIVKHFPGTLKPEDAARLDIVPLLRGHRDDEKETIVQPSAVSVKTAQDGTIVTIDPLEFMATTIDNRDGSVMTTVHNQFTAELSAEVASTIPVQSAISTETSPVISQPKSGIKKDSNDRMGSARTDYHSNKLLSDRAKKRRKLLHDKSEGRSTLTEDPVDAQSATLDSAGQYSEGGLSSHGITFRDPSTGVFYVQMQLLQDDPPHPELYADEGLLKQEGLDLPSSSDSEMVDHGTHSSEFVGSTINLQDLVG